jgi:tripartite-type tricarboxylate transporter receptor subunit TctC
MLDVPIVGEFVPGYEASQWYGIGALKGTPAEVIARLNNEVNMALADPKLRARLAEQGSTTTPMTPAEFGKLVADETEKWGKLVRSGHIKAE